MHRNKATAMTSAIEMAFSLCLIALALPTLDASQQSDGDDIRHRDGF
jgi:hypothetical protein